MLLASATMWGQDKSPLDPDHFILTIPHSVTRVRPMLTSAIKTHPEGVDVVIEPGVYHLIRPMDLSGAWNIEADGSVMVACVNLKAAIIVAYPQDIRATGRKDPVIHGITVNGSPLCNKATIYAGITVKELK